MYKNMDGVTIEKIYKLVNQKLKQEYGDNIEKVYVDIDEKNKVINVIVITKKFDPEIENKIFEFENKFEETNRVNSDFKVFPALSAVSV